MLRYFRTEINPTKVQIEKINKTIGTCRFIYNFYIAQNKKLYENNEPFMSAYSFSVWLNNEFLPNIVNSNTIICKQCGQEKAITKQGLWSKIRSFLFQEIDLNAPIKVELTPYQQKLEDEINEFLHQEITFKGIANFFKGKK